jgi:transglutaminase-like putative cysteine protease
VHAEVDAWGNVAHLHTVERGVRRLHCEAAGFVETHAEPNWVDDSGPAPAWYRAASTLIGSWPGVIELAQQCLPAVDAGHPEPDLPRLLDLAAAVAQRVRYRPGSTDVHTTAQAAWQAGAGVCQDQAQVFIAACRAAGVAARYVSGYFCGEAVPGVDETQAAALASHAWAEVCIDGPGRRWVGVDVTHGCLVDERHVGVAVGPDYAACPPVRGVRSGGGEEMMTVSLQIRPV